MVVWRFRLKDFLVANSLSTYRLAKYVERTFGVSSAHVYVVVNGKATPSIALLEKLHTALETLLNREVRLDELIEVERTG